VEPPEELLDDEELDELELLEEPPEPLPLFEPPQPASPDETSSVKIDK
jgi:hypothetical protein